MQVNDASDLWRRCTETLRQQIPDAAWRTSLSALSPSRIEHNVLVLSVPGTLLHERIASKYLGLMSEAASEAAERPMEIRLELAPVSEDRLFSDSELDTDENVTGDGSADARQPIRSQRGGQETPQERCRVQELELEPARDQVGPWHRPPGHVRRLRDRLLEPLRPRSSPVGGRGPGPPLQPSLHPWRGRPRKDPPAARDRQLRVRELPPAPGQVRHDGSLFERVRLRDPDNSTREFKRRYREECDVLLIDDVQFMAGKEQLQEEFFHTFNQLFSASKQIVITSDRPPKMIATLEDRLRSRFVSGLTTDIQPPELETRLAILIKRTEDEGMSIGHDVLDLIATHVKDNIRELEGALTRVAAYGNLYGETVTREMAERVLSDIIGSSKPRTITVDEIICVTAETFGFPVEDLIGPSRRRPLVNARQICMYVIRELKPDTSFPTIARSFGNRDHTTVMHAVKKVRGLMDKRLAVYEQTTELMRRIRAGE